MFMTPRMGSTKVRDPKNRGRVPTRFDPYCHIKQVYISKGFNRILSSLPQLWTYNQSDGQLWSLRCCRFDLNQRTTIVDDGEVLPAIESVIAYGPGVKDSGTTTFNAYNPPVPGAKPLNSTCAGCPPIMTTGVDVSA
jgi:hypothetical protein